MEAEFSREKCGVTPTHNIIDSCKIPHLIRTHFNQTKRVSEKVITGDRVTKRQDIRSSSELCNRTIVVTSAREWQHCRHPAPPQCCSIACSCTLTTCGLLGHVTALPCQDRDRDGSRSGNNGSTGAIHTNRAVSFRKLSGVNIKNCMLDVAVTSRVPAQRIKRPTLPATRTAGLGGAWGFCLPWVRFVDVETDRSWLAVCETVYSDTTANEKFVPESHSLA